MSRPVALLLTPVRPDAAGNGLARRAWRWAVELAADYELSSIVIASYAGAADGRTQVPGRVVVLHHARQGKRGLLDWVDPGPDLSMEVQAALPEQKPARVIVFRAGLHDVAALLPPAWRDVCEMDFDDWESATRRSLARLALRHGLWQLAWRQRRAAARYAALEREMLRYYESVHLAAPEDAERLRALMPGGRIICSPNRIVPVQTIQVRDAARRVLFVGTLGYLPNLDAALWLARGLAPALRRVAPGVEFIVAGAAPPGLAKKLRRAGIDCHAFPADPSALYASAAIAVAPLRGGGGTKVKILEAWAHRRPVVATSHAARGLGAVPGRDLLIADTAEQFSLCCKRIFDDPALAASLADAGHARLRECFLLPVV